VVIVYFAVHIGKPRRRGKRRKKKRRRKKSE